MTIPFAGPASFILNADVSPESGSSQWAGLLEVVTISGTGAAAILRKASLSHERRPGAALSSPRPARPDTDPGTNDTGGVLAVKSDIRPDGRIEISVNDTGPELPPGKADQIFDAFFTTKPQGSSMGLAISISIVESHGGRIWADGDAGNGATFHFTLPPAPVEAEIPVGAI